MSEALDEGSDALARHRIRTDLATSFVVEASAGTGKTTKLVLRIVATLESGIDVSRIAALTFTDKAAGELKLRLRSELEVARRAAGPLGARALASALARLEEARVSTIHTFCADLLRERPVEAGVDPSFASEGEWASEALFDEAFASWFDSSLHAPGPGLTRALARRTPGPKTRELTSAARALARARHLDAPWTRRPWDDEADLADATARIREVAVASAKADTTSHQLYVSLEPFRAAAAAFGRRVDRVEAEALVCGLARKRDAMNPRAGYPRFSSAISRDEVLALHAQARETIERVAAAADADLAFLLREELAPVVARYEVLKHKKGVLDFEDLLLAAQRLLVESGEARIALGQKLSRLFVDEFQDTDAVQAAVLLLLSTSDPSSTDPFEAPLEAGKLFLVGDPKQSIYRFRNADLATYERVKARVVACGGELLTLSRSFRSVPSIQKLVNEAFGASMTRDAEALQPAYAPLEPWRREPEGAPSIVALPVPAPYGKSGRLTKGAVQKSLPASVGAFVAWLVHESGLTIAGPGGGDRVAVEARHVCLLFRQLESMGASVAEPFIEELASRGVKHVLVGGRSFYEREEIAAVHALFEAIERPGDALYVTSSLRGLFFGFSDESLFEYKTRYGHLDPMRPPKTALPASLEELGEALAFVARLHRLRNRRAVSETLQEILSTTGGHVSLALLPHGEQALANVLSLANLARSHEARGALSFRSFVDVMSSLAERRGTGEAPIWEEDSDGVRLMTAHRAKGLEFPVVVLVDLTSKPGQTVDRHVDSEHALSAMKLFGCAPHELLDAVALETRREEAEGLRLAYVAATRARDMLVFPVVGDAPTFPPDSWLSPLLRAVTPIDPSAAERAPPFRIEGDDTVLTRHENEGPSRTTIRPGLHATPGGPVVFVDPAALALKRPRLRRVRGADLIAPKASDEVTAKARERVDTFVRELDAARVEASRPALRVVTATKRSHRPDEQALAAPVDIEVVPRGPRTQLGARFGTVVHLTLETVELTAGPDDVARVARAAAKIVGAPDDEAEAAGAAANSALAHPLFVRARMAEERGDCRREVPITSFDGDELVEGVVDLAFREEGRWIVVDFKTDAKGAATASLAGHRAQVATYARAIEQATGEPASGVLLFV